MPATVFTPELGARIVDNLRAGLGVVAAAAACRVSRRAIYEWLERTDEPYVSFALDVAAVRAELQRDLIADHYDWASDDANHSRDHKALAWRLERQFPKDWGARVNIRVEQEHELLFDAIRRELGEEIYGRVVTLASRLDEGGEEAGGRTPALPPGDDAPE